MHAVLGEMDLRHPKFCTLTVAGTNGKGSTVAMCEAILRAAGYKVGAYTSPHLVAYNERVHIDSREATDDELCAAFERIEAVRGATPLTYFEFGTLAALQLFRDAGVDIAVLEVGLGGRLDAVNAIDADVAIVCSVGIDHTAWLGLDRESIGREKAGIFRPGRPAICSDPEPPRSIADVAAAVGADLSQLNRDFFVERAGSGWTFRSRERVRAGLPYPSLRGDFQLNNAAGALTAVDRLSDRFPVTQAQLREGLRNAFIRGRFQVLPDPPTTVLDVAHNPQAAQALATTLKQQRLPGKTYAVFGMLIDKDIEAVARAMSNVVDCWYVTALPTDRGASPGQLEAALTAAGAYGDIRKFHGPRAALEAARSDAGAADRVVVFGSFYLVGDILAPQR